jgi:hypothetical protein
MALLALAPWLLGARLHGEEAAVAAARVVESAGVAWRLVDDLEDVEADLARGTSTVVRLLLDDPGTAFWDRAAGGARLDGEGQRQLAGHLARSRVAPQLGARAALELGQAADLVRARGWRGLGDELAELARPLPVDPAGC